MFQFSESCVSPLERQNNRMKLPQSPRTSFALQIYQWATCPTVFLDSCTKNYGDIFMTKWPGSDAIVFVSNPAAIKQILNAPRDTFNIAQTYEMLRPLVGKQSLMLMDGQPHQCQRSLVMPSLHGESLRSYGQLICEFTEQIIQQWKIGEKIKLRSCADEISMNTMLQVVFGSEETDQLVELRHKFIEMFDLISSPILSLHLFVRPLQKDWGAWSHWGRFLRLRNQVDRLIYQEITHRRQQPQLKQKDILSLLMAARDQEGQPMSDREIRAQIMTILSGKGTSASAILFALYSVYKHPEVLKRLRQELDSMSNPKDTNAIAKLPYLTAISQEIMRLYPLTLVAMRLTKKPFKIMGYQLPVGTQIFPNIYSTHYRQDLFPNPEQFKPERFFEKNYSPYEYLPFGGGHRRCIGYAFAPFQLKLVLATIVSNCQLESIDNSPIKLVRHGAGVAPKKEILMRMTNKPRANS